MLWELVHRREAEWQGQLTKGQCGDTAWRSYWLLESVGRKNREDVIGEDSDVINCKCRQPLKLTKKKKRNPLAHVT